RHPQDAEDAFQATFLTLARKAGSIGRRQALAAWLYRVAYRAALRARAGAARHAALPLPDPEPAAPGADELVWHDLRPVLDEELSRLPDKYRRPVVLCYLEGKTHAEAAEQLGCAKATVAVRLLRARERLRARLLRRGLALSAGALGALLAREAAAA